MIHKINHYKVSKAVARFRPVRHACSISQRRAKVAISIIIKVSKAVARFLLVQPLVIRARDVLK